MAVSEYPEADVAANLARVRERIAEACRTARRDPTSVELIAVTKGQSADAIREAYRAGQRRFGENYVQEFTRKAAALKDLGDLRWHFVGHLQRNKVKDVVAIDCAIDTLDSERLAEALDQRARAGKRVLDVRIEVNVGDEPQKSGATEAGLDALVARVGALPNLRLRGLMAIPPAASSHPESSRPYFRRLRELAVGFGLPDVSMGMSHDLEIAIDEGATMVRVGTAIFGERD
jgi:hypothetical protein